ncbi:MAG: glycosyltransferase [Chloroflexi bacterium]|nr:MAG: glycosyltransferase [Chloroflexota bacterium]
MSSVPTVSVVMSTRNRGAMIGAAIHSLIALDHPSFEIVVVDQSVDEVTADLVRGLSETDSRIRYVHTDRVGLSCGRNDGIAVSRGDVVAFTDDDCIVQPDWLSAIDVEMQDPRVAGVFGRVLPNEYRGRSGIDLAFKDSQERIEYAEKAIPWYIGHGANMAFRRADLAAIGGFDEILGAGGRLPSHEDGDMSYRMLASGRRVVFTPSSLVYHRQWRDWDERKRTERAYGLGAGGQFTKYIRCGDPYGFRLMATWTWQLGVRRFGAGLLKWRSRKVMYLGLVQLTYPWLGVWRSLRFGVDKTCATYLPETRPARVELVGDGLSRGLTANPPVTPATELAAETSDAVEHR